MTYCGNNFPHNQLTKFSAVNTKVKSGQKWSLQTNEQANAICSLPMQGCDYLTVGLQYYEHGYIECPFSYCTPKISSDLLELLKWPLAFRGVGQLLHLLYTSYTTGFTSRVSNKIQILLSSSPPPPPSSSDLFLVTIIYKKLSVGCVCRRYVLNMSKADWMDFGRLETANFNMRMHLYGTAHMSAVWRRW